MYLTTKNSVREALNSGLTINKLIVMIGNKDYEIEKLLKLAREKKIKIDYLTKNTLAHRRALLSWLEIFMDLILSNYLITLKY